MTRLPAAARIGVVLAAVTASAVLWHNLPTNSDVYAPFTVSGSVGEPVSGRSITATVTGVRTAAEVQTPQAVSAIGRWVVVQTELVPGSVVENPHADLVVGADTYAPTDRLAPGTQLGGALEPGFLTRGSWIFDVAPALLDDGPPMSLRLWVGDGRLDSRLSVAIDPARVESMNVARVERPDLVVP